MTKFHQTQLGKEKCNILIVREAYIACGVLTLPQEEDPNKVLALRKREGKFYVLNNILFITPLITINKIQNKYI